MDLISWRRMPDRQAFYERRAAGRDRELSRLYPRLICRLYGHLVPPGRRVLELGCSSGELLAALSPSRGLGIDFSPSQIERARRQYPDLEFRLGDAEAFTPDETFDVVILSDLVNDLTDVQAVLARLQAAAHSRTRLVLNFFNYLWRPVLGAAERLGCKAPTPEQSWLSTADMRNLLHLSGWEVVRVETRLLWPIRTPLLEPFLNRWLAPWLGPFCLSIFMVARLRPDPNAGRHYRCSVVVPARNEAGNIAAVVRRTPELGSGTELVFVEGGSTDGTWEAIEEVQREHPGRAIRALRQTGTGKGDAVRQGFAAATGEVLLILDADLTVPPEQLPKFYDALRSGMGEFINGVRLVYPRGDESMRWLNAVANKAFSLAFTWLLGQPIKDTLCGTKVLFREDYEAIARARAELGTHDPFGDFDLLFGAARLNLKIVDLPIRYGDRTYGQTNIRRWRHGWLLLRMLGHGARRFKFLR